MQTPTNLDDVNALLARFPAALENLIEQSCNSINPSYMMFCVDMVSLIKPFSEYDEKCFHRKEPNIALRSAMMIVAGRKHRAWQELKDPLVGLSEYDQFKRSREYSLLTYFFRQESWELYDVEFQLGRQIGEDQRQKLLKRLSDIVSAMGVGIWSEAISAFNMGNLTLAELKIDAALQKTPDQHAFRMLKAEILRGRAHLEEFAALDSSPDHPDVKAAVKLSSDIDALREQLNKAGIDLETFLLRMEERIARAITAGDINPAIFDSMISQELSGAKHLSDESRLFLRTAEYMRMQAQKWQDFSGIAMEYAKAVERELLYRVFRPFREQKLALPSVVTSKTEIIVKFLKGGTDVTLGQMGFLLQMTCSKKMPNEDVFVQLRKFTITVLGEAVVAKVIDLVKDTYVQQFRNIPAHPKPTDKLLAEAGRKWAYETLDLLVAGNGRQQ